MSPSNSRLDSHIQLARSMASRSADIEQVLRTALLAKGQVLEEQLSSGQLEHYSHIHLSAAEKLRTLQNAILHRPGIHDFGWEIPAINTPRSEGKLVGSPAGRALYLFLDGDTDHLAALWSQLPDTTIALSAHELERHLVDAKNPDEAKQHIAQYTHDLFDSLTQRVAHQPHFYPAYRQLLSDLEAADRLNGVETQKNIRLQDSRRSDWLRTKFAAELTNLDDSEQSRLKHEFEKLCDYIDNAASHPAINPQESAQVIPESIATIWQRSAQRTLSDHLTQALMHDATLAQRMGQDLGVSAADLYARYNIVLRAADHENYRQTLAVGLDLGFLKGPTEKLVRPQQHYRPWPVVAGKPPIPARPQIHGHSRDHEREPTHYEYDMHPGTLALLDSESPSDWQLALDVCRHLDQTENRPRDWHGALEGFIHDHIRAKINSLTTDSPVTYTQALLGQAALFDMPFEAQRKITNLYGSQGKDLLTAGTKQTIDSLINSREDRSILGGLKLADQAGLDTTYRAQFDDLIHTHALADRRTPKQLLIMAKHYEGIGRVFDALLISSTRDHVFDRKLFEFAALAQQEDDRLERDLPMRTYQTIQAGRAIMEYYLDNRQYYHMPAIIQFAQDHGLSDGYLAGRIEKDVFERAIDPHLIHLARTIGHLELVQHAYRPLVDDLAHSPHPQAHIASRELAVSLGMHL